MPAAPPLTLRTPHAVLAALRARPADVLEVRTPGPAHGAWATVVVEAQALGVRTRMGVPRDPRRGRGDGGRSGAEADVRPRAPVALDRLFDTPRPGDRWVALDSVQDPHNLGSILRTAAFFGVRGLITTADRAAPLTAVVYDVAAGGVEAVPHAVETNLRRALERAKQAGVWILGTSEHATQPASSIPHDRPWLVVVGNEEGGLRRLTLEACDEVCTIPPRGETVTSLNVGVAAGIMLATLTGT